MSECIWPVASSRTVVCEDGASAPEGPLGDFVKAPLWGATGGYATYVRTCGRPGNRSGLCHFHTDPALDAVSGMIVGNEIHPEGLEGLVRTILGHRWAAGIVREVLHEDVQSALKTVWGAA